MTTSRSRRTHEDHDPRRSASLQEPPTEASLPTLDEAVDNHRSLDTWGNIMGKKPDTTLRIVFQNIGGFSKEEEMDLKFEAIRRVINDRNIDIFGFTEANTCWDVVPEEQRPAMRTRGWWETSQWVVTHNRTEENVPSYQPGGVGLLCVNQVAHRTLRPGDDILGLGRWCWTRLRGPNGFHIRIISMYRPCFSNGPLSTYQQQVRKLSKLGRYDSPRDEVLKDISKDIQLWQDDGDHIIVLTDFNDDVAAADAKNWAAKLGLVEAITYLNSAPVPPTYQRGSRPIDGIFIAPQLLTTAAGGYLAFGDAIPSDHRAIWLDLHLPEICPPHPERHIKPTARRLQCKDPRIVARYNDELLNIIQSHNITQRVLQLQSQAVRSGNLRRSHKQELNALDRLLTDAKHAAEKHCRKFKSGQVQWSPPVTSAINKILFWKGILKRETGGKVGLTVLGTRAKKAHIDHIPYPGEFPITTIQEHISKAYKQFGRLKKDESRRDTWIAQLIEAQAQAWNRTKKNLWQQLRSIEKIRRTAKNVRQALSKVVHHHSLSMVIAPGPNGTRREYHQKAEMEKACMDEAGRRFTQARHTPFLTPPLLEIFGETGNRKAITQVLDGRFQIPSDCDRYAAQFLAAIARPLRQSISPRTPESYRQGWTKARETTSSSASGIHFGHYIAGTFNPEILLINTAMADIPLHTGFAYDRWKSGLNIMIEKAAGDFNVEKLRIILLFEADFNANNKWIGRAVMYQAEQENLMAAEQFGSRKFKSAIFQCLNKQLFYDLTRFRRAAAALCSNDAKSCYDRITLLAAVLCLCRLGCPQPAVQSMITTIHEMNHHIRTTFGDSALSANRQTWQAPIAGIGQGNGAGPQIWAAVSSPMFDIMRSEGFYAHVIAAISGRSQKLVGFAFVDDTDLCVYGPHITPLNVTSAMQSSVNQWQGLLRATGGALVPSKCFWYLIDFQWANNCWSYKTSLQHPGELTINDDLLHRVRIPRLHTSEARRTLGVRLAPDGNWEAEVQYLLSIATDWKVKMAASRLSWEEALFSLKHVVLRKLHYPLTTTTLSPQQCHLITSPLLQQGLPKAGVIRTFPRALAHGPLEYGGLDIPNLYTEQLIAHVTTILRYGPDSLDPTGSLLHANGEAMRLEVGYNGELLAAPLILANNITSSWIKHVWMSTQERGITILTNFTDIALQRQGDIELMRLFVQSGWQQPDLYTLNQCRMFLQAFNLSDIVDGNGDRILTQFWEHSQPADSPYLWPRTHPISSSSWNLWQKALTQSLHLGRSQRLALPLGKWYAQSHPGGWYYHPATNSIWHYESSQWTRHGNIPKRTRQRNFHGQGEVDQPPNLNELCRATVLRRGTSILLTGSAACEPINQNYDFCQALRSSEFSLQWGLSIQLVGAQATVRSALSAGQGYAVSDGSFKNDTGAAAWIIEGPNSSVRIIGQMHTPGYSADHSSFRSELAGIVGVLYTLTFWPPSSLKPAFRLACDGLSVVTRLAKPHPIEPTEPHFDLLAAARTLMLTSAYDVQLVFVRGHQDVQYPTVLSRDAWLNVEADTLAKSKTTIPHVGPKAYKIPGYPWGCYFDHRQAVKQLGPSLRNWVNGQTTLQYWIQRKQLTTPQLRTVDWPALGQAMRSSKLSRRRWASKQMSGQFAHGKNMVRWKQRSTAACPRCGTSPEDKVHILQCPQEEATAQWNEALESLQQWMTSEKSDPILTAELIQGLKTWRSGSTAPGSTLATQQQSILGWDVVLDGWLAVEWRAQQESYWSTWQRKKSTKRWISELIKKLWNVSWDMWAHRNGVLHSSTTTREDILDSRIDAQLTSLYNLGVREIPRDAFTLFQTNLEDLLQQNRNYKQKWIASVQAAQARKRQHDFGAYLPEQQFMRRWLGLTNPENDS